MLFVECEDYESPAWFPNNYTITHNHNLTNPTPTNILKPTDDIHGRKTNIEQIMDLYNNSLSEQESHKKLSCYQDFYKWSTNMETCQEYWDMCIKNRLKIQFDIPYDKVFDFSAVDPDNNGEKDSFYGIKSVQYLSNARFNVADSCFPKEFMTPGNSTAPSAIVFASDTDPTMQHWSHEYLNMYANRVALSLKTMSVKPGDAVGICMPMSPESVAIYLGIVKAGAAVVSIADSFSAIEIQTRMNLSNAKVIFTQDVISRGTKILPLYTRILDAQPERVVSRKTLCNITV